MCGIEDRFDQGALFLKGIPASQQNETSPKMINPHFFLQVDVPEECLRAASFTESRETTTWQKMIDTLQSWMQKASPYVCTLGSTVLVVVKSLVLSLGIMLEVFRLTLEEIIRKCRDSMKAPRLQVNRDSRMIGLLTSDLWSCQPVLPFFSITEAAAESSAADEIEVPFGACGTRGSKRF